MIFQRPHLKFKNAISKRFDFRLFPPKNHRRAITAR
jgi:hypothetical protein